MQVDPPAEFSVDSFNFPGGAPAARLSYFWICITGIDSTGNITSSTELLGNLVGYQRCFPRVIDGWQLRPVFFFDLHHRVHPRIILVRAKCEQKVGAFSGMEWHQIPGDYSVVISGDLNHV